MTQALHTKRMGNVWFNLTRISQTLLTASHPFHSFPVTVIHFCGSPFSFCLIHFSDLKCHCFLPPLQLQLQKEKWTGGTTRYHKLVLLRCYNFRLGGGTINRQGCWAAAATSSKFQIQRLSLQIIFILQPKVNVLIYLNLKLLGVEYIKVKKNWET